VVSVFYMFYTYRFSLGPKTILKSIQLFSVAEPAPIKLSCKSTHRSEMSRIVQNTKQQIRRMTTSDSPLHKK